MWNSGPIETLLRVAAMATGSPGIGARGATEEQGDPNKDEEEEGSSTLQDAIRRSATVYITLLLYSSNEVVMNLFPENIKPFVTQSLSLEHR